MLLIFSFSLFALTSIIGVYNEENDPRAKLIPRSKGAAKLRFRTGPFDIFKTEVDKDWHNNSNCQKLCLEMSNHKPYTKLLMYRHCLHNELVILKIRKAGYKVFCITTLTRGGMYTFINDYATCGNAKHGPILTAPVEHLTTKKKIWAQCIDDCSTDCYKDATLESKTTNEPLGTFTMDDSTTHIDKKYGLMCRRTN